MADRLSEDEEISMDFADIVQNQQVEIPEAASRSDRAVPFEQDVGNLESPSLSMEIGSDSNEPNSPFGQVPEGVIIASCETPHGSLSPRSADSSSVYAPPSLPFYPHGAAAGDKSEIHQSELPRHDDSNLLCPEFGFDSTDEEDYDDDSDGSLADLGEIQSIIPQMTYDEVQYEQDMWSRLSNFFLDFHARVWYGEEEFDRTVLIEHLRALTRYAVVDMAILVSWIIAKISKQRQSTDVMTFHFSIYTVMLTASASMLILNFFHMLKCLFRHDEQIQSSQFDPKEDISNYANPLELYKRLTAIQGNTDASMWKLLHLPDLYSVSQKNRPGVVRYCLTSRRKFSTIKTILDYTAAAAAEITNAVTRHASGASVKSETRREKSVFDLNMPSGSRSEMSFSGQISSREQISFQLPGKRSASDVSETPSILRSLLQSRDKKLVYPFVESPAGPSTSSSVESAIGDITLDCWIENLSKTLESMSCQIKMQEVERLRFVYLKRPEQKDVLKNAIFQRTQSSDETKSETKKGSGESISPDDESEGKMSMSDNSPCEEKVILPVSEDVSMETEERDELSQTDKLLEKPRQASKRARPKKVKTEECESTSQSSSDTELEFQLSTKRSKVTDSTGLLSLSSGPENMVLGTQDTKSSIEEDSSSGKEIRGWTNMPTKKKRCSMFTIHIAGVEHVFHKTPTDCTCDLNDSAEMSTQPQVTVILKMLNLLGVVGIKVKEALTLKLSVGDSLDLQRQVLEIKEILKHCLQILGSATRKEVAGQNSPFRKALPFVLRELEMVLGDIADSESVALLHEVSKNDDIEALGTTS